MSELHVRQIRANLEKHFAGLIDLSDVKTQPPAEQANFFLTRALAALALSYVANVQPEDAANAVTDGGKDNGLDAVYYHPTDRVLYLVQSKWRHDGTGTIERGEIQKFIKGFRDLLNARWERFNERIAKLAADLDVALNDTSTRIVLLVAYTGQDPLSADVKQDLDDVIAEMNDPTELVSHHVLRQGDVYAAVAEGLAGAPIDVEIALYEWGQVREPYVGFYGQVAAADVASWFHAHQNRVFAPNIRMFLGGNTDVNETILNTLLTSPRDFWYFNNGITALCRTVKKKPIGGNTRETGIFECHDLRIVNGAQTVGAIAQANAKDADKVTHARVTIRIISLEGCPPDFDKQVTRYTNTQNRIDRRDFVALDPQQERVRGELQLEGIRYVYKSGDSLAAGDQGFDILEAIVARACLQPDVALAIQAKREIGRLWEDITKAAYKILFNASVSGPNLWRNVQIVREVETALATKRAEGGRTRLLSVHANRFITHLVFASLAKPFVNDHSSLTGEERTTVQELTVAVFSGVLDLVNKHFPEAYLAILFKNATKCQQLKDAFKCPQPKGAAGKA
jgi:hypothetical protein